MAAAGKTVGQANIRVRPDTNGFSSELKTALDRVEKSTTLDIEVKADTDRFTREVREAAANAPAAEVKVTAQTDRLRAAIQEASRNVPAAEVQVKADTAKAVAQINEAARDRASTVDVKANTTQLMVAIDRATAGHSAIIRADVDSTAATARLAELSRDRRVEIKADVDRSFTGVVASMASEVADLGRSALSAGQSIGRMFQSAGESGMALGAQMKGAASSITSVGSAVWGVASGLGQFIAIAGLGGQAVIMLGQGIFSLSGLIGPAIGALYGLGAAIGAVIIGSQGIGDAFKAMSKGGQEARDALAKLSPAAADFVTKTYGLRDAWKSVQQATQEALYSGLGDQMTRLAGVYIPLLRDGLSGVASALNGVAKGFVDAVTQGSTMEHVRGIFANTKTVIDNLGRAIGPIIEALTIIGDVGSRVLGQMTSGAGTVAERFRDWIKALNENGKLDSYFTTAVAVLKDVLSTVGSLTTAFGGMFGALARGFTGEADPSKQFNGMADAAKRFSDWANSPDGQAKLEAIGNVIGKIADACWTVIKVLTNFVGAWSQAFGTAGSMVNTVKESVTNAWTSVTEFFTNLPTKIGEFFAAAPTWLWQKGTDIINGLRDGIVNGYIGVTTWFTELPGKIGEFFTNAWEWLKGPGKDTLGGFLSGLYEKFWDVLGFFLGIPKAIGDKFIGAVEWLKGPGKDTIGGFLNGLGEKFTDVITWLWGLPKRVWDALPGAAEWLVGRGWEVIGGFLKGLGDSIWGALQFIGSIQGRVQNAIGDAGRWLIGAGRAVIEGLWNGISSATGWIIEKMTAFVNDFISRTLHALGVASPSKVMKRAGKYVMQGFGIGIDQNTRDALKPVDDLVSDLRSRVSGVLDPVTSDALTGDLTSRVEVRNRPDDLREALTGLKMQVATGPVTQMVNDQNRANRMR